jgi:hypothetical protein
VVTPERAEELLSRRYRWLLHTYPAGYRDSRGEEIVGLLLDAARPGRRWPTPAEAADLLFGGLRRRMGWFPFVAVSAGLSGAGVVAFALAAGLSLFWLTGYELAGEPNWIQEGVSHLGPFETAAPIMYAAWILTAAVVCLVGRYARLLVLLSVSLVAAMPYLADLFGLPQAPGDLLLLSNLLYLQPPTLDFDTVLIVLGLVALAMPARPAPRTRRAIAAAVVAIAAAGWAGGWFRRRGCRGRGHDSCLRRADHRARAAFLLAPERGVAVIHDAAAGPTRPVDQERLRLKTPRAAGESCGRWIHRRTGGKGEGRQPLPGVQDVVLGVMQRVQHQQACVGRGAVERTWHS